MQSVKVAYLALAASRVLCSSRSYCLQLGKISARCRVNCSVSQTRLCRTAATIEETAVIRVPRYLRCLDLDELSFFVIDEADTMFDPSFSTIEPKQTRGLVHKAQLLVVGATFPGGVGEVLKQVTDLGSIVVIKSKMLHFLMPHVKQTFLKVKGADKILELNQALKLLQHEKGGGGALVFCNKSATVNWLGHSLDEMGVQHARLQGEMPAAVRSGIFHSFQKGAVDVLICTDIASRGLDTSRVRLVVNYDFPESHTDYIHRAGRVGRAGGVEDGEVLSFVTHPWDVELVQKIEIAARRRTSLPGMESEIHDQT
uniref:DEAD (Asp-Glu-Ala-Asp) box polypeptide 28 n=1 Tax=Lates calcarifer TaxID=8187 RepID=A0A4W6FU90_LATCA